MLDFSKRLGICLGIVASFCMSACGEDSKGEVTDKCAGVTCENEGETCDPADGQCKAPSENKCAGVTCENEGETCDPADGKCKAPSEDKCKDVKCENEGETCDPADGQCKGGTVVEDKCKDVTCDKEGEICDPSTGQCKSTGVTCEAPEVVCDNQCKDTSSDAENCGSCGHACSNNEKCESGNCVSSLVCEAPSMICGSDCIDVTSSAQHCGKCDNPCTGDTPQCKDSQCVAIECDTANGMKVCGGECIDITSNRAHCGDCDKPCDGTCKDSQCVASTCDEGTEACSGQCVNLQEDMNNCGSCGNACTENEQKCQGGECISVCGDQSYCGKDEEGIAICYDLQGDKDHCGACDKACTGEEEVCSGGQCVEKCADGEIRCGTRCVNPNTDKEFCGASADCKGDNAGHMCATNGSCKAGTCTCPGKGLTTCAIIKDAPTCEDAKTATYHCGCDENSAGVDCSRLKDAVNGRCVDSVCVFDCQANRGDCDGDPSNGCEADLTSPDHCGGCGEEFVCNKENTDAVACEAGMCKLTCKDGFTECGGKCINTETDTANCGGCGITCSDTQECHAGMCTVAKCDGDYVEGLKVTNHKGVEKTVKAYCIKNFEDLTKLRDAVKNGGAAYPNKTDNKDNAYILMSDITLEGGDRDADIMWEPIGLNKNNAFKGVFLGNGKTVSSDKPLFLSTRYGGLFGYMENAIVDGLVIKYDVKLPSEGNDAMTVNDFDAACTGGLVGYADMSHISRVKATTKVEAYRRVGGIVGHANDSILENSSVTGSVKSTFQRRSNEANWFSTSWAYAYTGGIAGLVHNTKVNNMTVKGDVTSGYLAVYTGGLIGMVESSSEVTNSTYAGNVTAEGNSIGGLLGQLDASTVENCHAEGNVIAQKVVSENTRGWDNIGGLIGYTNGNVKITGCDAKGEVKGRQQVGGLIGQVVKGATIKNCSANSTVHGASIKEPSNGSTYYANNIGGLIGYAQYSTISECKSTGKVHTDYLYAGGLIGQLVGGTLSASVSEADVEGRYSGGLIGSSSSTDISNCHASGDVVGIYDGVSPGSERIGGFVGQALGSVISDSSSKGEVSSKSQYVGGFVGLVSTASNSQTVIKNSVSESPVIDKSTGDARVGGFAGQIGGATITNCKSSGKVESSGYHSGGFVGFITNASNLKVTISQCESTGMMDGQSYRTGGFAGYLDYANIEIDNCQVTCDRVSGTSTVGGFIGYANAAATIKNCVSTADVRSTSSDTGGFAGAAGTSIIDNCEATSDVESTAGNSIGGFVGSASTAQIKNSKITGKVRAGTGLSNGTYVGGFIGYANGTVVENCSTKVSSIDANGEQAGGFVGRSLNSSKFTKCVAVVDNGLTAKSSYVGGFVGLDDVNGTFDHCFASCDIVGNSQVGGFGGRLLNSKILNSGAFSNVNGASDWVSGFVGYTRTGLALTNSYVYGKVTANSSNASSFIGGIEGSDDPVINGGVFYIADAHQNKKIIANKTIANLKASPYTIENNKAVFNGADLSNGLGGEWSMATCKVGSTDMTMPVVSGAKPSICK